MICAFCVSEGICQQDTQCAYKRNVGSRLRNHCYCGKALSITCSESVSIASRIKHAMRMAHILFLSVFRPAVPHFSTLSQTALFSEGGGGRSY